MPPAPRRRSPRAARRPRSRSGSRPRGTRSRGARRRSTCRDDPGAARSAACAASDRNVYSGWLNSRGEDHVLVADEVAGIDRDEVLGRTRQRLEPVHVVGHRDSRAGRVARGLVDVPRRPGVATPRHHARVRVEDDLVARCTRTRRGRPLGRRRHRAAPPGPRRRGSPGRRHRTVPGRRRRSGPSHRARRGSPTSTGSPDRAGRRRAASRAAGRHRFASRPTPSATAASGRSR